MKNITDYDLLIKKEIEKNNFEAHKVLNKFEKKFNKGKLTVTHHFNGVNSEFIKLIQTKFKNAGFKPKFIGNKPEGHITLKVSLL